MDINNMVWDLDSYFDNDFFNFVDVQKSILDSGNSLKFEYYNKLIESLSSEFYKADSMELYINEKSLNRLSLLHICDTVLTANSIPRTRAKILSVGGVLEYECTTSKEVYEKYHISKVCAEIEPGDFSPQTTTTHQTSKIGHQYTRTRSGDYIRDKINLYIYCTSDILNLFYGIDLSNLRYNIMFIINELGEIKDYININPLIFVNNFVFEDEKLLYLFFNTMCFKRDVQSSDFKFINRQNGLTISELRTLVKVLEFYPCDLNFDSILIPIKSREAIDDKYSFYKGKLTKEEIDELDSDYLTDTFCKILLESNNELLKHFKKVTFILSPTKSSLINNRNFDSDKIKRFSISNGIDVEILNARLFNF